MTEINMVSGVRKDKTTTYTATANKTFMLALSSNASVGVQIIHTGLNAADSVVKLGGSNDGVNIDYYSTTKTLPSGNGSHSFEKEVFPYSHIVIDFAKGTNSSGTIKILLTVKED